MKLCPLWGGVLNSGVICMCVYANGTTDSVLYNRGVLNSGLSFKRVCTVVTQYIGTTTVPEKLPSTAFPNNPDVCSTVHADHLNIIVCIIQV